MKIQFNGLGEGIGQGLQDSTGHRFFMTRPGEDIEVIAEVFAAQKLESSFRLGQGAQAQQLPLLGTHGQDSQVEAVRKIVPPEVLPLRGLEYRTGSALGEKVHPLRFQLYECRGMRIDISFHTVDSHSSSTNGEAASRGDPCGR